ncbi:MAG TPA: GntP family permease [Negativicutes bacterium]|nr:GntP family permease [Negativicutes bacterium]
MEVIGILLSLFLLMFFAYRGFSVIYLAPIFAVLAAASQGLSPMPAYTELFMGKAVGFIKAFLPVFLLGAMFGKVMEDTGLAKSIALAIARGLGAKYTVLSLVLAGCVLTYGGVNGMVAGFALYPVAASLFKEANWPKRFIPATIFLGFGTATMDAFPGTIQIQNIIPAAYFGTSVYAAPFTGIVGGTLILVICITWINRRIKKAVAAGEGYGTGHINESQLGEDVKLVHWSVAALPLLSILVLNYIFTSVVAWNPDILKPFLAMKLPMAAPAVKNVLAIWAIIIAEIIAIVMVLAIGWRNLSKGGMAKALNAGAIGSLLAVLNVASEVGYGNVIASLPGFKAIATTLLSIKVGATPLVSEAVTVNLLAGITGSASGGLGIALDIMAKDWLAWANSIGMSPEILHRIAAMAAGGMDTLPHNGGIITLLGICGLTHRQSYPDIFVITIMKTAIDFLMVAVYLVVGIA